MEVIVSPGVTRLGIPVTVLLTVYNITPKNWSLNELQVDGYTIWARDQGNGVRFSLPHEGLSHEVQTQPNGSRDGIRTPLPEQPGFGSLEEVIDAHETYQARTFAELQRLTLEIAREKGRVTADDIRKRVEVHGDRRIIGAALAKLCRDGWLTPVDFVATRVKTSHHRPIRVFHYNGKPPPAADETVRG